LSREPSKVGPSPRHGTLRLLYITGAWRSGSTLLDLMLGQHPGVFAAGELREIWQRGLMENGPCGCSQPFRDCPFWCRVGEAAFGGWEGLDLEALVAMRRKFDRPSRAGGKASGQGPDLGRYVSTLHSLLEGIRTVSGAEVIADSSKSPAYAGVLMRIDGLDLRVVHLLRDSRAVTFSWQRGARERRGDVEARYQALELRPEETAESSPPSRGSVERRPRRRKFGATGVSVRWLAANLAAGRLASGRVPSVVVKYEELVSRPRASLESILDLAGLSVESQDLAFVEGDRVVIRPNHTVFGSNRLRFFSGTLPLRLDDEWRRSMRRRDRLAAVAMTFPLLLRHGYPLWRGRGLDPVSEVGSEA